MENVGALGELNKFSGIRQELINKFYSLNYSVAMIVLNAKDFGVPQSRKRVFFVGTKQPLRPLVNADYDQFKMPAVSVRDAIRHLGLVGSQHNPKTCNAKITLTKNPILRKSAYAGMLFNGKGRPLNPDGLSATLTASMGGNRTPIIDDEHLHGGESWVEWYHSHLINGGKPHEMGEVPSRLRRLTINEAAILQSFPANYAFVGPQSKIYSQIGNAVPCNLAEAVAGGLMNVFKS
jgi:DNA (cytosine-5)-methyltransferase 1